MTRKDSIVCFLKYFLSVLVCVAFCTFACMWAGDYFSDGRFITNFAAGNFIILLSIVAFYLMAIHLIFPDCARKEGSLLRFSIYFLGALIVFLAVAWFVKDTFRVPAPWSYGIVGAIIVAASWFPLRSYVFRREWKKPIGILIALRNAILMILFAGVCYVTMTLAMQTAIMFSTPLIETESEAPAELKSTHAKGEITVHAELSAAGVNLEKAEGVDIYWNDEWFFQDSAVYNHDLARVSAVLSSFANSHSDNVAGVSNQMSIVDLFGELGFDTVRTKSYEQRSTITDNLTTLSAGATDVVACAVATKRISSTETGAEKTLVVISIRGSYGSEWLSDFNLEYNSENGYGADHQGFTLATTIAMNELSEVMSEHEGEDLCVLVCGHSRGGAVANLTSARLLQSLADDPESVPGLDATSLFTYTFATPGPTLSADCKDEMYGRIFNVMLKSDVVPRLPLEEWGYRRYGTDVYLPMIGDEGFDEIDQEMREFYLARFGTESESVPSDALAIEKACNEILETLPTAKNFGGPYSMLAMMHLFIYDINSLQVLTSHYLPTYIAWLYVTDAETLGMA